MFLAARGVTCIFCLLLHFLDSDKQENGCTVDSSLASRCMDFCQALASQNKSFTFSLTIGSTFAFSLDTKESCFPPAAKAVKRKSPSAIRRNTRRRAEFLKKKSEPLLKCTADFIDVTLASRDGLPAGAHKVVLSSSGSSSKVTPTNTPPVSELPTLPPPSPALATPALKTTLPPSRGLLQPARAVKTNPLICTHCGLLKKGHPGPTGDRCVVPRTHTYPDRFPTLG